MNINEALNIIEQMRRDFICEGSRSDLIIEARNLLVKALEEGQRAAQKLKNIEEKEILEE